MGLINRLKSLFGIASAPTSSAAPRQFIKDPATGVMVETDDPDHAAVIGMVFRTGKPVTATRDKDGKLKIETLDP